MSDSEIKPPVGIKWESRKATDAAQQAQHEHPPVEMP
jgi:hypothetical protein